MSSRFSLRPAAWLSSPIGKQTFNLALFSEVAPRYDFITRALSLGRDGAWKRRLLAALPDLARPDCLDLACGTGDLTRLLARRYPRGRVTGLDLTPAMLAIARRRSAGGAAAPAYIEGSMHALPCAAASLNIVTGGYALRNAPELGRALDEVARVLRPGGTAAFLDFSKPPARAGQAASHALLKLWGGFWGLALHGNPDVYGYIADSLRRYPDRAALRACFRERGLTPGYSRRFYGGLLELLVVTKVEGSVGGRAARRWPYGSLNVS